MGSAGMIGHGAVLLAQMKMQLVWASLGLVGALILGAVLIGLVERWRKRSASAGLTAGDQLSHFRELYARGVLTKEEFEQIRAQLAEKLRAEMQRKEATPAQATAPPEPPHQAGPPSSDGIRPSEPPQAP
ncbi:MAG: SHOCT domain-containing protein [Planctomycetes bacterium]|nr:SHOCT domain-containing protein [Planctomycetota bacterium]